MPTIIDEQGQREVSDQELARLSAAADAAFETFWADLVWRSIAEYDRSSRPVQLLRNGEQWAIGFWGETSFSDDAPGERWRDAQESMDEARLGFEPLEFAVVEDRWRAALMAD